MSYVKRASILATLLGVWLASTHSRAQLLDALVIANEQHAELPQLSTAKDARTIAAALTSVGCNVEVHKNLDRKSLETTLQQFMRKTATQSTAVVYFAGYSLPGEWRDDKNQRRQVNFLVPTDVRVAKASDVTRSCLALPEILQLFEREAGFRNAMVLLDCRSVAESYLMDMGLKTTPPMPHPASLTVHFHRREGNNGTRSEPSFAEQFASHLTRERSLNEALQKTNAAFKDADGGWTQWAANSPSFAWRPGSKPRQQQLSDGNGPGSQWVNSVGQVFCWCPAGEFHMGSPVGEAGRSYDEQSVNVTLSQGFWISKYEVTEREYRLVTKRTPSIRYGKNHPLSNTRSGDGKRYVETLTKLEQANGTLPAPWQYAIPSEAEWEYACRAGTKSAYSFGDNIELLAAHGNFADRQLLAYDSSRFRYAHPQYDDGQALVAAVGGYLPNAWGVHDMHGNVWEWCADAYLEQLAGGRDPTGPSKGTERGRIIRGGSWLSKADYCRSAMRQSHHDLNSAPYLGVRVILKRKP